MNCPICGDSDTKISKYDGKRRELVVRHTDGTECKRQPCDIEGRYDR